MCILMLIKKKYLEIHFTSDSKKKQKYTDVSKLACVAEINWEEVRGQKTCGRSALSPCLMPATQAISKSS